jgi:hypothetical protein
MPGYHGVKTAFYLANGTSLIMEVDKMLTIISTVFGIYYGLVLAISLPVVIGVLLLRWLLK